MLRFEARASRRWGSWEPDLRQRVYLEEDHPVSESYTFGAFELRVDRYELLREGRPIRMEPKPLEVLAELLRHAGELVTKTELMDTVWAGRVVTESVITRCINRLRLALEDESQTLIRTVHGHGYRFMGKVLPVAAPATTASEVLTTLRAGDTPPLRPNWRLSRALDDRGAVWLAAHERTQELRVFKFALEARQIGSLRREITLHRVLQKGLGDRGDIARLLDFNLEIPPYFLELEYCREGNLAEWGAGAGGLGAVPIGSRLELMSQAAEALAAAHSLGVLHRDIKPSNLLVWTDADGKRRIRWADFGSGWLLEPERLAALGITHLGATRSVAEGPTTLQGTLNYLAPEILRGESPTVRSDLYAFGVMLYQVLVGDLRTPLTVGWEANVGDELLRSDIAACAHDNPALRLGSANELATRLRSLEARRLKQAAERRREQQAAILQRKLDRARARRPWLTAAALVLIAGTAASLWAFHRAVRAEHLAQTQARIARAVIGFLDHDVLADASPFSVNDDGGAPETVRQAVDRAAAGLRGRFRGEPQVAASIRAVIGQVYVEDGDYQAAQRQFRQAIQLATRPSGPVGERLVQAEYGLAFTLTVQQKFAEARLWLDRANRQLAGWERISPVTAERRDVINGNYYFARQQFRAAAPWFERSLADARHAQQQDVSQIVIRETSHAWCDSALRRFAEAQRLYSDALATVRKAEKDGGTLTGTVEERYGIGLFLAGHDAAAKAMLQTAYAQLKRTIGRDGLTAEALTYLGWLELREGHAAEAVTMLRTAYRDEVASAGAAHRMTLRALACLGLAEIASGAPEPGRAHLSAAVAGYWRALGPAAAETQLFTLLLLEQGDGPGRSAALDAQRLEALSARRIGQAAPWQHWRMQLAALKSRLGQRNRPASRS